VSLLGRSESESDLQFPLQFQCANQAETRLRPARSGDETHITCSDHTDLHELSEPMGNAWRGQTLGAPHGSDSESLTIMTGPALQLTQRSSKRQARQLRQGNAEQLS
jgi:hypothetical protein